MPRNMAAKRLWELENVHTASCRLPYAIWATFVMKCAKNHTCPNRVLTAAVMEYINRKPDSRAS